MFEQKPLQTTLNAPAELQRIAPDRVFIAFERAVFGTVNLTLKSAGAQSVVVHLGEKLSGPHTIDRDPPGCVRYRRIPLKLHPGTRTYALDIPPDSRNTSERAIPMPAEVGEVMPFRYCEIEGYSGDLRGDDVRQVMVHYPFEDNAASFHSDSEPLNQIWQLCKHTIKATTFCGLYVDGDRERIPYEADAYINQLCHYSLDTEYAMARATLKHFMYHPTWPADWLLHTQALAWTEYMWTGDPSFLAEHYEDLALRTLTELARDDGLITTDASVPNDLLARLHCSKPPMALVDWPPASFTEGGFGERDDYDMRPFNTVVNAHHYRAIRLMAQIADVIGKSADAEFFRERAGTVYRSFNRTFFDARRGIYVDGEGATHASLHANMMPLAFGLVPHDRCRPVVDFICSKDMACSVYGAQYLLEALYLHGKEQTAFDQMTATHDRSWLHMMEIGATMTLEAWDWKYKNNLDWNHAWGAAPGNIIPRFLMGVRPLSPAFADVLIRPRPPEQMARATLTLPTPQGPIRVRFDREDSVTLRVDVPPNVQPRIEPPPFLRSGITVNGSPYNPRQGG